MQYKSAAALLVGLAAQQVAAVDGSWNDQPSYSVPENTDSQCSSSQQSGYNWSGLSTGSFSSYGSNSFSGFSCSNSFGKRGLLSNSSSVQDKYITGSLDDQPSMSCEDGDSMNIDHMQVSSTQDTDVECSYAMPDGTTCTEHHSCSSAGSVFLNKQCGGAKSVTFKPGKNAPSGCSIGVHSIGFNCASASSSASATAATAYASTPVNTESYSTTTSAAGWNSIPGCYGKDCSSTAAYPSSPINTVTSACYGDSCSSSWYAPAYASVSSAPAAPCYGDSCSASWSAPAYAASSTGAAAPCYGDECSTTLAVPASYSAWAYSSPAAYDSSSAAIWASASSSPASPNNYPAPNCPAVLPKCMKTWLFKTGCTDVSDSNCFCGSQQFIEGVMGCINARSGSESDTQAAASYLMGICAPYIPNNPAIITACPSTITPAATPAWSAYATANTMSSPAQAGPCTTITYSSPIVVPATYSTGPFAGQTITINGYTTVVVTTITLPQVHMTTSNYITAGTTTCSIGLGAGKPSSVYAYTTPATQSYPIVYSSPAVYSTPAVSSSPTAAQTSPAIVCSEYVDGQPQCGAATPAASASAPPAYYTPGSSPAAATTPAYSAPAVYSSPAAQSSPAIVCSEYVDGQPQCGAATPAASASAPPAYYTPGSSPAAATTPAYSAPAVYSSPAAQSSPAIVCSEYVDGQPQCSAAVTPAVSASAPPAYSAAASAPAAYTSASSPPVAAVASTLGTTYSASPSASYSNAPVVATGAGVKTSSGFAGLVVAVVAAWAAL